MTCFFSFKVRFMFQFNLLQSYFPFLIEISNDKKYINKILNDFYNSKENRQNIENKVELKK